MTPTQDQLLAREAEIIGKPARIEELPRDEYFEIAMQQWTTLRSNYAGRQVEPGDPANLPAIFFTMLRRANTWQKISDLSMALTGQAAIDVRSREILILRTGWLLQAPYEFGEHVTKSREAKCLTDEEIKRVTLGADQEGWSEYEAALITAVDELNKDAMISDKTWAVLERHCSPEVLIELPMLVGFFSMIGYLQNALRLPLRGVNKGLMAI